MSLIYFCFFQSCVSGLISILERSPDTSLWYNLFFWWVSQLQLMWWVFWKKWWSTSWSRHCWTDRIPPAYWISWYSFLLPSCFYAVGLVSLCFYAQRCSHVGFPVVWCSEGSITDLGIQLTITLSKLITSKVWKEWAIAWLSISIIHVKDLDSRNIRWYLLSSIDLKLIYSLFTHSLSAVARFL